LREEEGSTMAVYDGVRTMSALLSARAAAQPDRPVIRTDDGDLTYADLDGGASQVAAAFAGPGGLGLAKGDTAAVMLPNGPEYMLTWMGLARAGIIEVPLNTGLRGDLLAYMLNQAEVRALVIADQWVDRIDAIRRDLRTLEHVVTVGDDRRGTPFDQLVQGAGADAIAPPVEIAPSDPSVILFTSGTTGPSKGVVLTHNANFRLAANVNALMGYGPGEVLYNAFPLFHVNARYTGVLCAFICDGEIVLPARFSASAFWDTTRAKGVTAFNYMGAMLVMLFKQPERENDADNPVRRAYGAPAPITIYKDFEQRFGMQLVEVYGSTEAGTVTENTVEEFRVGSCGRATDYYEVEIHDENDLPCPPRVDGEIVVRPNEPHVLFEHYYRMPEETLHAFRNLWFHTGDRGWRDEDGYFYFVDRMKDAIRRRGENISSWEVEKVLTSHPSVEEAAVIGVPSELTEEEVLAVVVTKRGHNLSPEELLDHGQDRLPHFAVPRYVRFASDLPKTPSQRIEKYRLREIGLTDDTWDREEHGYEVRR
jgi:crotonobetaine/carnitine-CoA ligase